jgi:hypothetical protein
MVALLLQCCVYDIPEIDCRIDEVYPLVFEPARGNFVQPAIFHDDATLDKKRQSRCQAVD